MAEERSCESCKGFPSHKKIGECRRIHDCIPLHLLWQPKDPISPPEGTGWYGVASEIDGDLKPLRSMGTLKDVQDYCESANSNTGEIRFVPVMLLPGKTLQPIPEEKKGTPGPWLYYKSAKRGYIVKQEDGEYIAYDIENKDDAQLIADAPETKARLDEAVEILKVFYDVEGGFPFKEIGIFLTKLEGKE